MEHPDVAAFLWQQAARAEKSGEKLRPGDLTYLCPAVCEVAAAAEVAGQPARSSSK